VGKYRSLSSSLCSILHWLTLETWNLYKVYDDTTKLRWLVLYTVFPHHTFALQPFWYCMWQKNTRSVYHCTVVIAGKAAMLYGQPNAAS
jgi:hypothetical protein